LEELEHYYGLEDLLDLEEFLAARDKGQKMWEKYLKDNPPKGR
jgi:hypothetical protein